MNQPTTGLYSTSLCLLTDLYQLTMAYGYWKSQRTEQNAVFHLFFRKNPFQGGYVVSAGLALVLDYLKSFRFADDDIEYLRTLTSVEVDAMPEGTVAFPHQPLLRVKGPILECQLLETALLNIINFQSLIATKAARTALAAGNDEVLEFGLRRAQGIDGGVSASRAAYIGGCAATSNVLAGKVYGIPVRWRRWKVMPTRCLTIACFWSIRMTRSKALKKRLPLDKNCESEAIRWSAFVWTPVTWPT